MTWPSPPGKDESSDSTPEPAPQTPWRPAPDPAPDGTLHEPRPGEGGSGASAVTTSTPDTRASGRSRVVPIAVGSVGVLALLGAGWLALDRGLLSGTGSSDDRVVDVTQEPEEVWSYTYLPRSGEVAMSGYDVQDDAAFFLVTDWTSWEDETWTLERVGLEEGEQEWSVDVDPWGGGDTSGSVSLVGVAQDRVYLVGASYDPTTYDPVTVHQVLDASTGEVLETYDTGDDYWVVLEDGLYVQVQDELNRLDPEDPTGPPVWTTVTGTSVYNPTYQNGYLEVTGDDRSTWVNAETGERPGWFTDDDTGLSYSVVGDQVYRTEWGSRGSFLERLDDDGSVMWSADADAFRVTEASGTPVVLAMESGRSEGSSYEYLQRLDPRDGEEMWDEGLEADFDGVSWVVGDVMVLRDYTTERDELYALDDGERISRLRSPITQAGSRVLYSMEDGRLSALDLEGEQLWSVRARGATGLFWAPGYLITHDQTAGRLSRWE